MIPNNFFWEKMKVFKKNLIGQKTFCFHPEKNVDEHFEILPPLKSCEFKMAMTPLYTCVFSCVAVTKMCPAHFLKR